DDRADAVAATVDAVDAAFADGARPDQVAVLARVNATLVPVQVALATRGVSIAGGVGPEFTERVGVRAALAWLRLAHATTFHAADLFEATRRPSRGVSPRAREWISEQQSLD